MYQLDEISAKVKRCKEFLAKAKTEDSEEMENMVTCYLLVHICGEYEKLIKNSLAKRASKAGDLSLAKYLSSKAFNPVRSLLLKDIGGNILENLGQEYVENFQKKIQTLDEKALNDYGTIVNNRNLTAHGQAIKMSFDDLTNKCEDASKIVAMLAEVLCP